MSTDVQTPRPVRAVAELREVQGPSALGGGSRRFFDLLKLISVTEFKRVYFGTVLGYLWSLLRPLGRSRPPPNPSRATRSPLCGRPKHRW